MKFYKIVTEERESYLAGFLKREDKWKNSTTELLDFLYAHGFILKYKLGSIVKARPDTMGISGFMAYNDAESYAKWNLRTGMIVELEAMTDVYPIRKYIEKHGGSNIAPMNIVEFRNIVNGNETIHGDIIWQNQRPSCCVCQMVKVLT